ncbi:MAG: hypothetical protein J2P17_06790 [Mycobacterium sp.]|nr:hypothetical protein [Mycobacterium sp.]
MLTAAAAVTAALGTAHAHATTINCQHAGPIVGHPGMEYICYVVHDDNHRETFYAPGPVARP